MFAPMLVIALQLYESSFIFTQLNSQENFRAQTLGIAGIAWSSSRPYHYSSLETEGVHSKLAETRITCEAFNRHRLTAELAFSLSRLKLEYAHVNDDRR
jgi:hypothetical protein